MTLAVHGPVNLLCCTSWGALGSVARVLQAMSQGARTVVVPEGGLSDKGMDALGRALGQHPRIIFLAVYDWRGEAKTLPAECRRALALAQGERESRLQSWMAGILCFVSSACMQVAGSRGRQSCLSRSPTLAN